MSKMSTLSKVRGILFILIATSVALLVTIALYSQEQIRQQSSIIETERIVKVNQVAGRIDLIITDAEKILENAAKDENIKNSLYVSSIDNNLHGIPESVDKEKRIVIRNILSTYQDFESMGYILPNGDIYFVEPYDLQKTLSLSNVSFRDYYKAVIATHDIYVGSIIVSAATNHPVAPIAVPIFSANGSMVGMLSSGVDLQTIQKRLKELHSYTDERILVVDNNKAVVADSAAESGYKSGQILPEIGAIQEAFAGKNGTSVESINGQKMFLAYHPITAGQNTWAVVSMQPYDEAFQSVNATIQESYTLAILILIITSTSSYYLYKGFKVQQKMTKELENANQVLQRVQEQLKEVDRSKEEFAAMITHELKTPLITIQGYGEMLSKEMLGKLNGDQKEAVEMMNSNSEKLLRLIDDIMDVRKIDLKKIKLHKKEISVSKFINQVFQDFVPFMKDKEIEFVNSHTNDSTIVSDEQRLSQVLGNLIKNSVDFIPQHGGRIEIGAKDGNQQIVFYVKDNGTGIPKERQKDLFKKFYQVDTSMKRNHGGTGLGLVICKGIVEGLGGQIWVESEEGKGSSFYFSIPTDNSKTQGAYPENE